jgi:hypothetical protein
MELTIGRVHGSGNAQGKSPFIIILLVRRYGMTKEQPFFQHGRGGKEKENKSS